MSESETAEPVEPIERVESIDPVEPIERAELVDSVGSIERVESIDPVEPVEPQSRPPPAWPVYVTTVLLAPLSMWAVVTITTLISLAMTVARILSRGDSLANLGTEAEWILKSLWDDKLFILVLGVIINCSLFGAAALLLTFRTKSNHPTSRREGWLRLRIGAPDLRDMAIAALGLVALTSALDAAVQLLSLQDVGSLKEIREVIAALGPGERLALSVPIAIGAGTGEELYFRGYMLTRLELAHRRWPALIITSIAFGLFHWDVVHTPLATIMGLYLGLSVLFTGSLWPGVAAHVANNLSATMLAGLETPDAAAVVILVAGLPISAFTLRLLARRHAGEARAAVW